jgi:hypothetical protein
LRLRLTWKITEIERYPEYEQSEESYDTEDVYKFSRGFHLSGAHKRVLDFFGNIGTLYAQKPSGPTAGVTVIGMLRQLAGFRSELFHLRRASKRANSETKFVTKYDVSV